MTHAPEVPVPVIDVPPSLYAMSEFMNYTMFSFMYMELAKDRRSMKYRIQDRTKENLYLQRAQFVIVVLHLPLRVILQMEVAETGIQSYLFVKYTGA
jgi:hypothetical protein